MLGEDQIYIVVDMETDGPVPGTYSMLGIAAVATTATQEVSSFARNLLPHPHAIADPETVRWWKEVEPEAWAALHEAAEDPAIVMHDFYQWVKSFNKTPIFVAHPLWFDYGFVRWYLHTFVKSDPFHSYGEPQRTLDLASFISGKYGLAIDKSSRQAMPEKLLTGAPDHTHLAIDDARGYAAILRNVLNDHSV